MKVVVIARGPNIEIAIEISPTPLQTIEPLLVVFEKIKGVYRKFKQLTYELINRDYKRS